MKRILPLLFLFITTTLTAEPLKWFDGSNAVCYQFMTPMESVVRVGESLFKQDILDVTGKMPVSSATMLNEQAPILIYQLNNASTKQKAALKKAGFDLELLSIANDAFQIKAVANITALSNRKIGKSANAIIVCGSNGRGTAYGILELSRMAGVSPWVWWGDVVPEKKTVLTLDPEADIKHSASVEMRGIFINDEDWSTRPWSQKNNDPSIEGRIGAKTYRKIFELLLRLRANTIWPGMHPGTKAFFMTEGAKAEADSCGILIGTSHCEPLLRNNVAEWNTKERGAFNYITNKEHVHNYWTERLKEVKSSRNNIFTIGMRGIHDGSMEGVKTMDEKFNALQQVIDDQQKLIAEHIGNPAEQPQVFVPYKEVLELYEKGLKVPDYVTLMWCDDNYGYITRLSNPEEQKRSGGAGIYYHLSYWGRPHDYLWLTTTQPGLIYSEMKAAYDHNVRKLWVVNVHDVKIAGYDLELFLDMAWDINSVKASTIGSHYKQWLTTQFGSSVAEKIYPAIRQWVHLTGIRRPEHMGWNQVELDKKVYERGLSPVSDTEFSQTSFGNELELYLAQYEEICKTVHEAEKDIRLELKDAYFARIIYPVCASAAQATKILYAQKARQYNDSIGSNLNDPNNPAVIASAKSLDAYERIKQLTNQYNAINSGKWKGLMDMQPRQLPVYMAAPLPVTLTNEEIKTALKNAEKVTTENSPAAKDYISCPASSFTSAGQDATAIDMLGHSMSAVQLPKRESLTYNFICENEADAILRTALIPTQPSDNGDIRYAVSIDGGEETIFSLKEKYRSERWKLNVLRQQTVREQPIHLTSGKHTLTIRALDDHIVVDQWMIDFNLNRGKFYLFPQN